MGQVFVKRCVLNYHAVSDPFDADNGPDELLKRLVAADGAPPLALEPGAHMDGLERVRRRRKKKGLRGHDTFHHSGEHRRAGA